MTTEAPIGHNRPPAHIEHIDTAETIRDSVEPFLGGLPVASEKEAELIQSALNQSKACIKAAEDDRKALTKPLDDQKKAIMDDFRPVETTLNPVIACCQKALTAWLNKLAAEKRAAEEAERARIAAEQQAALEAMQSASLEDMERGKATIDQLVKDARVLDRSEKAAVRVEGEGRATGLRTVVSIQVEDGQAMLKWFWRNDMHCLLRAAHEQAERLARANQHIQIDGVKVVVTKEVR